MSIEHNAWLRLLAIAILIAINAFFVTAEFAIVSVRRSRINQLVAAGDVPAKTVQSLQRHIERLLSTTQIGITFSSLALGWLGEAALAQAVQRSLLSGLPSPFAHGLAIPMTFLGIAYLQIVLGELCPKSWALLHAETLARWLGPPSLAISRIFKPFIVVLNRSTRLVLRLSGVPPGQLDWQDRVTPEELQLLIATERETTGLEADARELLNNVFEFGDVTVEAVMVPRTQMICLGSGATFAHLLAEISRTGHARFPVAGDSLDDIRGVLDFKNLAMSLAQGSLQFESAIADWASPPHFIPETTTLSELLPLMQRSSLKMVIVVDEYGGTSGLVTLQDLIAEIIGDDDNPQTQSAPELEQLDPRTYLVSAQVNLEDLNEELQLALPLIDEYQTLGGFLAYQWQKIPREGEVLRFDDLEFQVVRVDGQRLEQIQIQFSEETSSAQFDRPVVEIVNSPDLDPDS
ncbi:MAG: hemolysin family protein [Cyanobacteria bacterium P01_H01_bin.15]